jgi:DNA-binding NtrC family response regulator
MNVLIVDDQMNLARITAVALRLLGCQTFIAASIEAASQKLDVEKIDAVFLDVNLGGESGMEYLSLLKARPAGPPVIMFTAQERDEVAGEALRRGAFDCLTKPFTLEDLRRQLARIEEHRQSTLNQSNQSGGPTC